MNLAVVRHIVIAVSLLSTAFPTEAVGQNRSLMDIYGPSGDDVAGTAADKAADDIRTQ